MKDLPNFDTYGSYSSSNYGANALVFSTNEGRFWFSYKTLVAFLPLNDSRIGKTVRQNDWGPTTGKHLNWIDGGNKKSRVNEKTFVELYNEAFDEAPEDLKIGG